MTSRYGVNDRHAMEAIARGDIEADPTTGHLTSRGKPVGTVTPAGYIHARIRRHDVPGWVTIGAHRIVWMALIAPIPPGMVVRHANGHRWDNRPGNLELANTPGR